MRIIGLTGGIGSGKSTVSSWLKAWGAPLIDADVIVRQLQQPGAPGWRAIWREFGWPAFTDRGEIARKKLGRRVFREPAQREKLDAVLHPLVQQEILCQLERLRTGGAVVAVVDIPLLIERGWTRLVDEIWLVYTTPDRQIERIGRRDRLGPDEAGRRLAAQMPLSDKLTWADRVIDNTGSLAELKNEVCRLWQEVAGSSGEDCSPE